MDVRIQVKISAFINSREFFVIFSEWMSLLIDVINGMQCKSKRSWHTACFHALFLFLLLFDKEYRIGTVLKLSTPSESQSCTDRRKKKRKGLTNNSSMMVDGTSTVEEVATLTFLRLVINLYFTCLLSLYVPVLRTVLSF